jgi:hypothetical protein
MKKDHGRRNGNPVEFQEARGFLDKATRLAPLQGFGLHRHPILFEGGQLRNVKVLCAGSHGCAWKEGMKE